MYDSKYLIAGLSLFIGLFIGAALFVMAQGPTARTAQVVLPKNEGQCVEDTDWMRANHPQLLIEWRDDVVRGANRIYTSRLNGKTFEKSLTNTCLSCHENKQEFCDSCHAFNSVTPNCWDCHNVPEQQHPPATARA